MPRLKLPNDPDEIEEIAFFVCAAGFVVAIILAWMAAR